MKRILALALAFVLALSLAACGGGNSGGSSTTPPADSGTTATPPTDSSTPPASQGGNDGGSNALFEIPQDQIKTYNNGDGTDIALALSEIPSGIFKGVGELESAYVMLSKYGIYKYDVILKFNVKSGVDAAKSLTDFYKSIGATVEEKDSELYHYAVTFEDWGVSTEVVSGSDYVNLQLNVVKQ
ncbi:MAG: hypothetical protein LBN26_09060 [Christensenellaceae bacterium]|jgi:hypothetical protein|nr:hypothetical protein [Christensenellaceae bacterium]